MRFNINGSTVTGENGRSFNCASYQQACMLAGMLRDAYTQGYCDARNEVDKRWKWGWLVRKESAWLGVHYSDANKRWCINLIPCVTLWVTKPGGRTP